MEINTIIDKTENLEKLQLNDLFNSIILLILLISGGFVNKIAGCSLTKLASNMYIKHINLALCLHTCRPKAFMISFGSLLT